MTTQNLTSFSHLSTQKPAITGLYDLSPRLQSVTLSPSARAVHTHYLNKPDGWNLNRQEVRQALKIGDYVLRRSLKELERNFLVIPERVRQKDSKQFAGFCYHRFSCPEEGKAWAKENDRIDSSGQLIPVIKTSGKQANIKQQESSQTRASSPAVGFPHVENQRTKKERSNKESYVCVGGQASPPPTPSVDDFVDHFACDPQLDPTGAIFGILVLKEIITGYFEHCAKKGTVPNLTGCRYRLEHQKAFREQAEAKRRTAERLAAERLERLRLEADKLELLNEQWHMDNLNAMKVSGQLINPDYLNTASAATFDCAEIWPQE